MQFRMKAILLSLVLLPGALSAADAPPQIPLWANGAPGFEDRRNEPEIAKDYWVRNIHNPSITVFLPPREKANGTAVLVVPGGGHRELVFQAEGVEPARYFNERGVAAFVLKHRLARETNSPYSLQKHPLQDGQRAMRMIRSRAAEWNVNPDRIGVVGFSAGGEVASMIAYSPTAGRADAADPIDRGDARANFQIVIYPGPLGIAEKLPAEAPPAFFLVAADDRSHADPVMRLVEQYRAAKLPVELHLYAKGGHGFNLGMRSKLKSIRAWPQRMTEWMEDQGLIPTSGTN